MNRNPLYFLTTVCFIVVNINFLNRNNLDITFISLIIIVFITWSCDLLATMTLASSGAEGNLSTVAIIVKYRHLVWV